MKQKNKKRREREREREYKQRMQVYEQEELDNYKKYVYTLKISFESKWLIINQITCLWLNYLGKV